MTADNPTKIKISTRSLRTQQSEEQNDYLDDDNPDIDQKDDQIISDFDDQQDIKRQEQSQTQEQIPQTKYSGSEFGDDLDDIPEPEQSDYNDEDSPPPKSAARNNNRRASTKKAPVEEDYHDEGTDYDSDEIYDTRRRPTRRGRPSTRRQVQRFVEFDDGDPDDDDAAFSLRGSRLRKRAENHSSERRSSRRSRPVVEYLPSKEVVQERHEKLANERALRAERRRNVMYTDDEDDDDSPERRNYSLRTRRERPNYVLPPPILDVRESPEKIGRLPSFTALQHPGIDLVPWNNRGSLDDSDTDDDLSPSKRPQPAISNLAGGGGGLLAPSGGMGIDSLGTAGPSNLGKVGDAAFADADPLGVNTKISFDSVGGLDEHVRQLKEMVSLPLLYPEVFQRFNVTPPRGVLFHGPPGTGKTLIARALAASCSNENQKISFFMRKGADCLSKWIGEAERQLRLLFEEAKAVQPSIIFFDEIDGLAPVRSSKQEQIHASIVSTLLALMDGMDGRGQVIVIGATNRPDAVDPALRRPGRFDREFYFPLPNEKARSKIIEINTKEWDPPLEPHFVEKLANLTKGYGGADLRALCTEAALNAVQRRYPQIYKTNNRLLLDPKTINVQAKDFMRSIKKLIPSSARSSATSAAPLPQHLTPLLGEALIEARKVVDKVIPRNEEKSIIEEAEYEDEVGNDGGFSLEVMRQNMNNMRTFRPRMMVYGEEGMGQSFIGPALLHYLEGYNVQSLDLATLLGDSTRTIESACVQMILEAKRNKPSVIYIPSLHEWCNVVSEAARATVTALLNTISPSDPVLVLAMLNSRPDELPRDVKRWFGFGRDTKVALKDISEDQIREYCRELIDMIQLKPNMFPDTVQRKKRKLEELPIAPPVAPREPTERELNAQIENDARIREHLKWRLGAVLEQLKKKFRRFMKSFADEIAMVVPLPVNTNNNGTANALARVDVFAEPNQEQQNNEVQIVEKDTEGEQQNVDKENDDGSNIPNGVDESVSEEEKEKEDGEKDETDKQDDNEEPESEKPEENGIQDDNIEEDKENSEEPAEKVENGDTEMAETTETVDEAPQVDQKESDDDEPIIEDRNDSDFEPEEDEEAVEPQPEVQTEAPPEVNAQENMEKTLDDELMALTEVQPGETQKERLMIYDIDLEKIHFNVYKDNYVNPAQFVDDVAKIVHNAELDKSDQDRLWKAEQLLTHARVLVDQAFDAHFRIECQRMADRESKRIAEYKEKRKKEREEKENKKKEEEALANKDKDDQQQSSNEQTENQDEHHDKDPSAESNEDAQSNEVGDQDHDNGTSLKRPREGEMEGLKEGPDSKKAKGDVEMHESLTEGQSPGPENDESEKQPEQADQPGQSEQPEQIEEPSTKSPTPEPEPEPEFVVDKQQLDALLNEAVTLLKDFNVDELEQTRAAISSVIWEHRYEWNRQSMIDVVRTTLHDCKYDVEM
ncbi:AAA-domain-containing protein [Wallemia mellicola]|nr:AAA-domain-containing protein [Wallemia mellicola]